jgi:hypothetical protein
MTDNKTDNSELNSQISDALFQLNASVSGIDGGFTATATSQTIAQAIALALHNAVAAQQHAYILRNALTAAAANAILEGKRDEAEAILQLAESRTVSRSLSSEIAELFAALKDAASIHRSV